MFDDLIGPLMLALLVGGLGWLLGIIGFFRAGAALAELRTLRMQLAGTAPVAPASVPFTEPPAAEPTAAEPPPPGIELPPLDAAPPAPSPKRRDFEEILTTRWGVWLGAAALLLSGVFLLRYAVEAGWFGPAMRCTTAALAGAALVAAGDRARRHPVPALPYPDYVPAALAAGGTAILFGAAYGAGVLYALVPPLLGFVLMAAVSGAGLLLSLRFGPLVAAVGIVGAFVTPLLVQTDHPSLPGLFAYLLVVAAAALATVRYSAWTWLGWATTVAGAGWVLLATLGGPGTDSWAPALFVPALALLDLVLLPPAALDHPVGRRLSYVPVLALGLAGLVLSLVDPGTATRAGVLLLAPVTLGVAARRDRLAPLPFVAALLALLLLLGWGLPPWHPTGEPIDAGDRLLAVLPGGWVPAVLRPFLQTALGVSALFAAVGLWGERRTARPVPWAGMVAAVPVLVLALAYARVRAFQADALWAAVALAGAAGLTAAAALAMREGGKHRAGVHAAGAVAALALGLAMLLSLQWLTVALALLVPALAVIEAQVGLPALRRVAAAVAAVALVRLLANWSVLDYALDQPAVFNGRAPAYLVAMVAFAAAARVFRRQSDDTVVRLLEAGAVAFGAALVALEVRQWATDGLPATPGQTFTEAAVQVAALAAQAAAALWLHTRTGRTVFGWAWRLEGTVAAAGGVLLILLNPAFGGDDVGPHAVIDALLPAYALPALCAAWATTRLPTHPWARRFLSAYALLAAFTWVTLEVRHLFHPDGMAWDDAPVLEAELWSWSGAWLLLAVALLAAGVVRNQRPLRLAALALVALVTAKVFLVDMGGLTGLWRVLSFAGLGLALIGLGRIYQRIGARRPDALAS